MVNLPKETAEVDEGESTTSTCENHYVDLRRNGTKDEINDNCIVSYKNA